jgi:hypothetical protein
MKVLWISDLIKAFRWKLKLTELPWFQDLYGKYKIVEENGERWCEMRRERDA